MKSGNNSLEDSSGVKADGGSNLRSRLLAVADKFDNNKPIEPVSLGLTEVTFGSLGVAKSLVEFLQQDEAIL